MDPLIKSPLTTYVPHASDRNIWNGAIEIYILINGREIFFGESSINSKEI